MEGFGGRDLSTITDQVSKVIDDGGGLGTCCWALIIGYERRTVTAGVGGLGILVSVRCNLFNFRHH